MEGNGKVYIGKDYEEKLEGLVRVIHGAKNDNDVLRMVIDRLSDDVAILGLEKLPRVAIGVKTGVLSRMPQR